VHDLDDAIQDMALASITSVAARQNALAVSGRGDPSPDSMPRVKYVTLLFLPFAGCALGRTAENEPSDPALIAQLEPGTSTSKDVVELLGAPVDVVQLGFNSAYLYRHTNAKTTAVILIVVNSFRQDERQDRLWVFFDEKGTLTHYGSTLEAKNSKQAWPFNRIYKKERYEGSQPEEPAEENSAEKPDKKEEPAK
jgi:outer membrane protein assembly factor BamE (lipoprotein component of BamABCDE complex)